MPIVNETNEEYHATEPASKSVLWKAWDKTPFHAKFEERKETHAFDFGRAAHTAILEPEKLDIEVLRGPVDRRGNRWKDALEYAEHNGATLLVEKDHDAVMVIRDLADTLPMLSKLRSDGEVYRETSCYHTDEETGMQIKTRPDLYNQDHAIIADVKNMASASPFAFSRDVPKFGYHVQDALYSDVWSKGSGMEVDSFLFIVFEKSTPPMVALYELDANAIAEGHAIYRDAMSIWQKCEKEQHWPGYSNELQSISLRNRWDYKLTMPEGM